LAETAIAHPALFGIVARRLIARRASVLSRSAPIWRRTQVCWV